MIGEWYDRHILPHVIRIGCANPAITELRAQVAPLAAGREVRAPALRQAQGERLF